MIRHSAVCSPCPNTCEKWGLTILSQGACIVRANTQHSGAGGQNGLSPFFALFSNLLRVVLFLALPLSTFAIDITKLKPSGYVNDFAHALDAANSQRLTAYCGILERATGAQMAIVTVDTLDGDDVADVANKLYHQWGIGKKPNDEGVLILFAVKDKKDRAEIGYGLEPVITDADAGSISAQVCVPFCGKACTVQPAPWPPPSSSARKIAASKNVESLPVDVRVRTRTTVSRGPSHSHGP